MYLCPGLPPAQPHFSGMIFQYVTTPAASQGGVKRSRRSRRVPLARGGRYDSLLSEFRRPGKQPKHPNVSVVGVSIMWEGLMGGVLNAYQQGNVSCVCVCVRERDRVCVCVREREIESVCVCVRERERERECVCVCVCVCVRERERERERERDRKCVCTCASVYMLYTLLTLCNFLNVQRSCEYWKLVIVQLLLVHNNCVYVYFYTVSCDQVFCPRVLARS